MADDCVKNEASSHREGDSPDPGSQGTVNINGEAAAENQTLSKRQRKKLLKQHKWEDERELRK